MRHPEKSPKKRRVAVWILLALLCVGATELAACRIVDPDLFHQLTDPVVAWALRLHSAVTETLVQLPKQIQLPVESPAQEELTVNQLAGDPAILGEVPMEDPAVTEFTFRDGQELLTGGSVEIVYFNQGEEPWASQPFGPDQIAGYGCGPTAMSMVVSSLTGQVIDPADMAQFAYQSGYCAPGSGSYLSIVPGTADAFGLTAESVQDYSAEALSQDLASGYLFVALMTRGHFTSSGHFILLRGITLEGKVLVADPNSRERSLTAWDPALILSELSSSRSNGAPLWRFSSLATESR